MTAEKNGIFGFVGQYSFLSNFHPCSIVYQGITYPSTEHAFQAAKTDDLSERKKIAGLATAGLAKKAGRSVSLRKDWDSVRVSVMQELTRIKYTDTELAAKLIATQDLHLEETNWWGDCFWGVCRNKGSNNLGKILMAVRSEIKPSA